MVERFKRYDQDTALRVPLRVPITSAFTAAHAAEVDAAASSAAAWNQVFRYSVQSLGEYAELAGAEHSAANAPTSDEIADAVGYQTYDTSGKLIKTTTGTGDIDIPGGKTIYGQAFRKGTLTIVSNDLEVQIKQRINALELQAERENWKPDALWRAIDSTVNNHVAVLDEASPGTARQLRADNAIYGNAAVAGYTSKYITRGRDRARADFRTTFELGLANIDKFIDGISLQFEHQWMRYPDGTAITERSARSHRRDELRELGVEFDDAKQLKITSDYLLSWLTMKQREATQLDYTPSQIEDLGNDFWVAINDAAREKIIEAGLEATDVGGLVGKIMSGDPEESLPEPVRQVLGMLRPRDRQALEGSIRTLENDINSWRAARFQQNERKRTTDILELEIEIAAAIATNDPDQEAFKDLRAKMGGLDPKRFLELLKINTKGGLQDAPEIVRTIEIDLLRAGATKFTGADLIGFLDEGQLTFKTFSDYAGKYAVAGDKSWIAAVAEIKSRLQITEIVMFKDFKTFLDSDQATKLKKVMAAMEAARRADEDLEFNAQHWVHENFDNVIAPEEIRALSRTTQIERLEEKITVRLLALSIPTIDAAKRSLAALTARSRRSAGDDEKKRELEEMLDWQADIERLEADETD